MTMHDHRSPAEIEREIEEERRGLTGTINELQSRFSLDRMTSEAGDYVRDYGGEFGRNVARTVRENPIALALAGAGIAWMILGSRRHDEGADDWDRSDADYDIYGDDDLDGGYADAGGVAMSRTGSAYRTSAGDRYEGGYYDESFEEVIREDDPSWAHSYAEVLGTPDEEEDSLADRSRDRYSEMSGRAKGAYRRTRADAEGRVARARVRLNRMRERLAHGTEDLSEDARARIVAARERAIDARHRAARQVARQRRNAEGMYNRQPLAAGAIALAAGAAVAAALPRTRMEDDYVGDYSDRLMHEAERIFEQEREKAGRVASATADEAKAVFREKSEEVREGAKAAQSEAKDVAQRAQDEAKEGAQRVADRAKEEAKKEKLGKPGE